MKKFIQLFIVIIITTSTLRGNNSIIGFNPPSDTTNLPNDSLKGDFNGDGKIETLFVTSNGCIDEEILESCICILSFSNNLPSIKIVESMGADLYNLGDLNDNGTDEFGYIRVWHGIWQKYHVLTLKNNVWVNLVPPFIIKLDYLENGFVPIEKDKNKKGYVIVRTCEMKETEVVIIEKSIKVR
jgi:hypothetical protein